MKAMLVHELGGPEQLTLSETPAPDLGSAGIRIAVHAAGVNFPDLLLIAGKYQFMAPLPFAPGHEVAGEVTEVGADVDGVSVGDRVVATTNFGCYAEQVVVPAQGVIGIPDALDYVTAAAMPMVYGTAYHALVDRAAIAPGDVLLVTGAAGGVGLATVELGHHFGARVIAGVGSDAKGEVVRDHGADEVINYTDEPLRDRVKKLTNGAGADIIFDPVGGDVFDQCMRCIAWDGRVLVVGFAGGRIPEIAANRILLKNIRVVGVYWGAWATREPAHNRRNFEKVLGLWQDSAIRPRVHRSYPLAEAPAALHAIAEREVQGKVVLTVDR